MVMEVYITSFLNKLKLLGPEVAAYVAKHFEPVLTKDPLFKKGDYGKALYNTFLEMDVLLRSPMGRKELASLYKNPYGEESMAGCTACVCLIVKDKMYVANAGDSRCVIATKDGVFALTKDHKPTELSEKNRIEFAGGNVYQGRINGNLNVSRGLGDLELKDNDFIPTNKQLVIADPDIRVWDMSSKDEFLVIGCDGIFDHYPSHEICQFISNQLNSGKSLKQTNEALLDQLVSKDPKCTGLLLKIFLMF